jgi:hypothetical protein
MAGKPVNTRGKGRGMGAAKSEDIRQGQAEPGRVVVTTGAMERPARPELAPVDRNSASAYVTQTLPIALAGAAVPPWVHDLSRLLERHAGGRDDCFNLRSVERVLRMPGASLSDVPDDVIRAAGLELRWLVRREAPSRALARMLDQFEHGVLHPALRRLHGARPSPAR